MITNDRYLLHQNMVGWTSGCCSSSLWLLCGIQTIYSLKTVMRVNLNVGQWEIHSGDTFVLPCSSSNNAVTICTVKNAPSKYVSSKAFGKTNEKYMNIFRRRQGWHNKEGSFLPIWQCFGVAWINLLRLTDLSSVAKSDPHHCDCYSPLYLPNSPLEHIQLPPYW